MNRYGYVLNNPLKYTDPTGHKETACTSHNDPDCSAVNGGSTGNTHGGGGNGNGKNKNKHGIDEGADVVVAGGLRAPDYRTGQIGFPLPWITENTFGLVGGAATVTYSNGHLYAAGGLSFGKTFLDLALFGVPISGNISGGWLLQSTKPTANQLHSFLTGLAINVSIGFGGGGGVTWGNIGEFSKNDFAGEAGVYTPQVGVTATYTLLDLDTSSGDMDLLP